MATADFPRDALSNLPDAGQPLATQGAALRNNLARLAARRNAQRFWHEIVRALAWGVGTAALWVLAYKFYLISGESAGRLATALLPDDDSKLRFFSYEWPFPLAGPLSSFKQAMLASVWWQPALLVLLSLLVGIRNGKLRRAGAFDAALDADQLLGLNDRLASALAFTHPDEVKRRQQSAPEKNMLRRVWTMLFPRPAYATATPTTPTALVPALVSDAAVRAASLNPREVYPHRFGRPQKSLAGAMVALTGFCCMPDMPYLLTQDQKTDAKKTLPEQGKKLQAIAKDVREDKHVKDNEAAKKLAKKLAALGKRMERGRMARKQALVEMAQLRDKIQKEAQKNQTPAFQNQMEKAQDALSQEQFQTDEAKRMQEHLKNGDREKAARELEKLAEKIKDPNLSKQERDKAAHDLEKAAQALRRQGGAQNQQIAKNLEEAAQALRKQTPQNQQKQNQQGQQNQQNQQGQQGQKNQQGQQGQQKQQGQQGQQNGQQNQQGQQQGNKQQGQNGQQNQQGQQGQKQQGQNGQQNQQGQQGQQQGQQQNQSGGQQQQRGQQGQQQGGQQQGQQGGQQGQQQGSSQSLQNGSNALKQMAQGMSGQGQGQSGANSESLQRMLGQIQEAERQAGSGGMQSHPGHSPENCPGGT